MSRPTTLYRFFDAEGALLYVGITSVQRTRWHQHAATKEWWDQVSSATTEHFATRPEAETAENHAIEHEGPKHNVRRPSPPKPKRLPRALKPRTYSKPCDRSVALTCDVLDPVGEVNIAERTGVQPNTVHAWMKRGLLPEPRFLVGGGRPVWDWNVDIVPWLRSDPRRQHLLRSAGSSV